MASPFDAMLRSSSSGPIMDGLRVAYLNIEGARNKLAQIRYILQRYDLDVLFLGEAQLTPPWQENQTSSDYWYKRIRNEAMEVPGYSLEREDRKPGQGQGGGGILAYITDKVNYKVIKSHTAVTGQHPLQYIYIHILDVHIVGVYLPPPYKTVKHTKLLESFSQRFRNHLVIMGDMNIDWLSRKYPHSKIERYMGYIQLVDCYTRVSVLEPPLTKAPYLSGSILDHIYSKNSDILESGVVRCGISDHDLIYCTIECINRETEPRPDILQHDVPFIVSQLLGGSSVITEQTLIIQDPIFWLLARSMEIRRLNACKLVEASDADMFKTFRKTSMFSTEINNLVRSYNSRSDRWSESMEDIIVRITKRDTFGADGCLSKELNGWVEELGEKTVGGVIFINKMQSFFGICFPDQLRGFFGLTVKIPHTVWKSTHTVDYDIDIEDGPFILKYQLDDKWHQVVEDRGFWESDMFEKLVGHQYLECKLQNILKFYKWEMVFSCGLTGTIYIYLLPHCNVERCQLPQSEDLGACFTARVADRYGILPALTISGILRKLITTIRKPDHGTTGRLEWNLIESSVTTESVLPMFKRDLGRYDKVTLNPKLS